MNQVGTIRDRYKRSQLPGTQAVHYSGMEFEEDVHNCLSTWFPCCVLPGLRVFSPSKRSTGELAHEIDNLFHLRSGDTDYLVMVEAKGQPIAVDGNNWFVEYGETTKCAREQVEGHIETLREYLEPISRNINLQFVAIVTSPDAVTPEAVQKGNRNAELILLPNDRLMPFISERFNFERDDDSPCPELFRVSQSPFLDLLRLSLALPALGHPELASAIRYVERCRRTLDQTLFDDFKPRAERWLINGSAGMGKSVLLAYAAAVLSCGQELYRFQGDLGLKKAAEFLEVSEYDPAKGPIGILAMSGKQLESLRGWFQFFEALFEEKDLAGDLHFRRPEFLLARNVGDWIKYKRTFSAVFLDEAHDLPDYAAHALKELFSASPFYLTVACDRHQQLRLSGSSARVVPGFDFTNKWVRLKQIYRNPAPVYIASLALMFRWFADGGPKVIPPDQDLATSFGFDVHRFTRKVPTLTMKNDAHPANSWSHVVAAMPDVATAALTLRREKLGREDVLWVRFSEEDPDFDYENLHRDFTYHNCRSREAHKLSDKYIKGQDFPVVVIEGFPSFMDRYGNEEEESKMWQFRRELYLCASRATSFLYLVCDVKETEEIVRIRAELARMLEAVGSPHGNAGDTGSKPWTFRIAAADDVRSHEVFLDTRESAGEADEQEPAEPVPVPPEPVPPESKEDAAVESSEDKQPATEPDEGGGEREPEQAATESEPIQNQESGDQEPEAAAPPTSEKAEVEDTAADSEELEPEEGDYWELTIPEPQTAKQFAKLAGADLHRVVRALRKLGCFKTSNQPVEVNILARIAPEFSCTVVDGDGNPVEPATPESSEEEVSVAAGDSAPAPKPSSELAEEKVKAPPEEEPDQLEEQVFTIRGDVVVSELAEELGVPLFKIIAELLKLEVFVATDQEVDFATASRICKLYKYPHRVALTRPKRTKSKKKKPPAWDEDLELRIEESSETFQLGKRVFVRSGNWIKDRDGGIGRILRVNVRRKEADCHEVWFAKPETIVKDHALLGRTAILDPSQVPKRLRRRFADE